MTGKADFTAQEWELIAEGPPLAGLIVVVAQRGGMIRESLSMAKSYTEAREQAGASELLDEIVSAKPEVDRTKHGSVEELREHGLKQIRDAVGIVEAKATAEEAADYKRFVLTLAERTAEARREGFLGLGGERVSDAEREALAKVADALGLPAPSG